MSNLTILDKDRQYPKVTRKLELKDYHSDMAGDYLDIWLNWTGDFNKRMTDWASEYAEAGQIKAKKARDQRLKKLDQQIDQLNAEFWGCTPEQVRQLWEVDSELWMWINQRARDLRDEYRDQRKKAE